MQLRISTIVPASIHKVYDHVTAFGPEGPVDEQRFRERYSVDIRHSCDGYIYTEDIRRYPDDPEEIITWRCTFKYPRHRSITALDSDWSDRHDNFEPLENVTRWTVQWSMHGGPAQKLIRFLFFKLVRGKVIRREIQDPVVRHFKDN